LLESSTLVDHMDDPASVMPQNDELHAGSPHQSVHSESILFFRVVIWRLDIYLIYLLRVKCTL
jgi:hypothetical protein